MQTRPGYYIHQLRESLWFLPGLMVLGAGGLAYGLITFDAHSPEQGARQFPLLFGVGADGSRSMLTAIAGSMLSVAALTFTLTLSALSQMSSQYSPRILRNFMRDRLNQFVMGYFVSVFTYFLIVLGSIRSTDEGRFVPATAVLFSLLLALGGVVALIAFIHHIAESLQTGTIVRHIFNDTLNAIDQLFPSQLGEPADPPLVHSEAQRLTASGVGWHYLWTNRTGYLQHLDNEGLLRWAVDHGQVVRLEQPMGTFLSERTYLFSIRPATDGAPLPTTGQLDHLLTLAALGPHRNVKQDPAFGIQQLVDITLKALSLGINDTTTAIMAIDYLGAVGTRLAQRPFPSRWRTDAQQELRVLARTPAFEDYIRLAFDLPRINAKGNHAVLRRLLSALAHLKDHVDIPDRLPVLYEQIRLVRQQADETLATDYEKEQVRALADSLKLTGL